MLIKCSWIIPTFSKMGISENYSCKTLLEINHFTSLGKSCTVRLIRQPDLIGKRDKSDMTDQ
jgi:hypothetical protein